MDQASIIQTISKAHKAPAFHYLHFDSDNLMLEVTHGMLDVNENSEIDTSSTFHAFSLTKTLTAVAILQLVSARKISLTDYITQHIPDYNFSEPVTIRQLLSHQSGIRNPLPLKWIHPANEHHNFSFSDFADDIILKNLKLKRKPGVKFAYSNVNYLVLGRLIEKVTGSPYEDYINQNILQRLQTGDYIGFDHPENKHATGYHPNSIFQNLLLSLLIDKKKSTYKANNKWIGFHPFCLDGTSYGGLICSARGLMTFCQALIKGKNTLLPDELVRMMFSEERLDSGKASGMALGWFTGHTTNERYCCHAGGGGGYYAEIRIYPDLNQGSVLMTNGSGMRDKRLLDGIGVGQ